MQIVVKKAKRSLTLTDETGAVRMQCRIALGSVPVGHKHREGDGRTPEGAYCICLKREKGKFGCALGISYPSLADAMAAALEEELLKLFEAAESAHKRPPWGTSLGGEIYIHGGGTQKDWTAGCIALADADMRALFDLCTEGDRVIIES